MKKIGISKRDIMFFLLGILFSFILSAIYNWKDAKQGFKDGYESVRRPE